MVYRETITEKAALLKALSNPIRLCIVKHLCSKELLHVGYFVGCMGASQSLISQNLIKLKDVGILDSQKDGQSVKYFISNDEAKKLIRVLFEGEEDV